MMKHEFTNLMSQSGYDLFVDSCAKKVFHQEIYEGPEFNVDAFIDSLEHENFNDIKDRYETLLNDYHKAKIYPHGALGKPLSPSAFRRRWGVTAVDDELPVYS